MPMKSFRVAIVIWIRDVSQDHTQQSNRIFFWASYSTGLESFDIMMFEVRDVVFVISPPVTAVYDNSGSNVEECSFVIDGRAPVQNGWKCFLRSRRQPVVYDPKKQAKNALREAVRCAFKELDDHINFPVFQTTRVQMSVSFYLVNSGGRDIDNMVKFLQDAIEGVVFDNDKFVYEIHADKHEAPYGNEATIVKVALQDEM